MLLGPSQSPPAGTAPAEGPSPTPSSPACELAVRFTRVSGSRGQLSLVSLLCYHHHSPAAACLLSGPGREGSRQPGISMSPVPPRHAQQPNSKASPADCSSSPCKEAPCWVPTSCGGPFHHAARRHERPPQLPQLGGGCRHAARSAVAATGHRDATTPVTVHAC